MEKIHISNLFKEYLRKISLLFDKQIILFRINYILWNFRLNYILFYWKTICAILHIINTKLFANSTFLKTFGKFLFHKTEILHSIFCKCIYFFLNIETQCIFYKICVWVFRWDFSWKHNLAFEILSTPTHFKRYKFEATFSIKSLIFKAFDLMCNSEGRERLSVRHHGVEGPCVSWTANLRLTVCPPLEICETAVIWDHHKPSHKTVIFKSLRSASISICRTQSPCNAHPCVAPPSCPPCVVCANM